MVSTKHSVEMVQVRSRYVTHARTKLITYKILSKYLVPFIRSTSRMMEKPQVVVDYNDYMLGVDKLDQLASYYSFLHKSVKWWRKVFFWCVEVAVINAYIVYKEQAQSIEVRPMCHLAFRRQLIEHLSEPLRSTAPPGPRRGPRVRQSLERLQPVRHFMKKGDKRRDCVVCSNREEGGSRHLTLYSCSTCSDNPSLCPSTCFEAYHKERRYR